MKYSLLFVLAVQFFVINNAFADKDKTKLVTALNFELDTLNPIVSNSLASSFMQDTMLRWPMALSIDGKPQAFLVKEIPTTQNHKVTLIDGKDGKGMKVDIEFLEKATWGDGVPVTCEDLKTTWEIGSNPNVSTPGREQYTDITDIQIDAKNPKKCSVFFKKASWQYYLSFPRLLSAHMEKPIYEKYKNEPQSYERNSLYVREPTQPGLYNGPYRVAEYKMGDLLRLVPNEHFYGKAPSFKTVVVRFITNSAAIEANLLSGAIDMVSSSGFSLDQALAFEKRVAKENLPYKVNMKPSMTYSFLQCNLDNPILKDVRVRQALSYMVNREEIINSFYGGKITAAYSFVNPGDSYYSLDPKIIHQYKYSKTTAGKLLDDAGWVMKPDGYRYKDGKKLTLSISATADLKIVETIEVFVKNAWKSVGVDLQIKNVPGRILFSEVVPKRNFDIAFYSTSASPDYDYRASLHSTFIPNAKNSYSGQNSSGWNNPKVDKWLDQEEVEFSAKKRAALMNNIAHAYNEELPDIPMYFRTVNSVTPVDLKGYDMAPHQFSEFLHIEDWHY